MKRQPIFACLAPVLLISAPRAYQNPPEYGPAKGTLVIAGGARARQT